MALAYCQKKAINVIKVPLPCSNEPRMLLIVELEDYYFGNTHFALNAEDRMRAVDIIKREVEELDLISLSFWLVI